VVSEGRECPAVGWHGVVVEETSHDLLQPFSLLGDWQVHASSHFLLQFQELRHHTVSPCFPLNQEAALAGLTTDEGKTQEVEGLRFAQPALLAVGCRVAAEFNLAPIRTDSLPEQEIGWMSVRHGHRIVGTA
jgi:hypothetical protein